MLALAHPTGADSEVPADAVFYDGPRIAVADFFTEARTGRAQTTLPSFRDGDTVSCPQGTEWRRYDGRWIVPGRPGGLILDDRTVTGWWQTRHRPASQFVLVHRLNADETDRITSDRYISRSILLSLREGEFTYLEPVSGAWLRQLARRITRTPTVSVHLELPTGIVTFHSPAGDVFFHPTTSADTPAPCA
ncbi:hypothetical protein [Streptomyces sp. PT19]|uniref:hypothetical protein n=1 Tax=Streptomyces sp. PT19 TaxID=3452239 RepID=UPI003F7E002E